VSETESTLTDRGNGHGDRSAAQPPETLALVLVFAHGEPDRGGEVLVPHTDTENADPWSVFGRGEGSAEDPHPRVPLVEMRPGHARSASSLGDARVSRVQLRLRIDTPDLLTVERLGRASLFHNEDANPTDRIQLRAGDTLRVGSQLLFLATMHPLWLPPLDAPPSLIGFPFGASDGWGLVGESPVAWALRERIAFAGLRSEHVLITGASGTGKEKVARAIHGLASSRPLVARNAATFPEGLIDAELFGNARNYPNAGMAERAGLIGQADGSALFLDEFGELPAPLQAHLLRVLDAGEYQRLGDNQTRHARFRLIAATNRPLSAIKDDLLARLPLRVAVPDLETRREDVPLLARHLLAEIRAASHRRSPAEPAPYLSIGFTRMLVRHRYTTNVRELRALLLEAVARARGPELEAVPTRTPTPPPATSTARPAQAGAPELTAEEIQAALDRNRGNIELTWRELALSSRFALARLISRHGLRAGRTWRPPA